MGSALFYAATSPEGMLVGMVWVLAVAGIIVFGLAITAVFNVLITRRRWASSERRRDQHDHHNHDWRPQ